MFTSWLALYTVVSCISGLALFFFGSNIMSALGLGRHETAVGLAAASQPLRAGFVVVYGWFRAGRRPWLVMVLTTSQAVIQIVLTLLWVGRADPVGGVMGAQLTSYVIATALALAMAPQLFSFGRATMKLLRPMLRYSLPFVPAAMFSWALALADRAILAGASTEHQVALYQTAIAFSLAVGLPVTAFQQAFGPFSLSIHTRADAAAEYRRMILLGSVVLGLLAVWSSLMAPELMRFLFGERYAGATVSAVILSCGQLFVAAFAVANLPYLIVRRTRPVALALIVAGIVDIVLCLALAGPLGASGAAWAMFAAQLSMPVVLILFNERRYFVGMATGRAAAVLASACVIGIAGHRLTLPSRAAIGAALGGAAALVVWNAVRGGSDLPAATVPAGGDR